MRIGEDREQGPHIRVHRPTNFSSEGNNMKQITKKVSTLVVDQWDGGQEEWIVHNLRDLGYTVCFQTPRPDAKVTNDDGEQVADTSLMVVVSRWNWEISYVEVGEYVTLRFYDSDGDSVDIDLDRFDEVVAKVKAGTLEVVVTSSKPRHLAKEYDI